MSEEKTLPNTLSGLLRVAVEDGRKVQADPRYVFDMSIWHDPMKVEGEDTVCSVCMAGAVMAMRLDAPIEKVVDPDNYQDKGDLEFQLRAIDNLRSGDLVDAYRALHWEDNSKRHLKDHKGEEVYKAVCALGTDIKSDYISTLERAPWVTYLRTADELEKLGL